MIPSSFATLVAFLFVIAPGLTADLLESRRRAGVKESSFREVGRIALFSLACSSIGGIVVGVTLELSKRRTNFDPSLAVRNIEYAQENFWSSVTAVVATSVIGCGLAVLLQKLRFGSLAIKVHKDSAWAIEFSDKDDPRGTKVFVQVDLLSGERYSGKLAGFTPNIELADREITLTQPLWVKRIEEGPVRVPEDYQRLIIRGDQIKTIAARKE